MPKMKQFAVFLILIWSTQVYSQSVFSNDLIDSSYFTNENFNYNINELHPRIIWYSMCLSELNEPIINNLQSTETIYRYVNVNAFGGAYSIRIVKNESSIILINSSDKITNKVLTAKEWIKLSRKIKRSNFWQMEPVLNRNGKDGFHWIIEGYQNERYHVVDRWVPKKQSRYGKLCMYLKRLASSSN